MYLSNIKMLVNFLLDLKCFILVETYPLMDVMWSFHWLIVTTRLEFDLGARASCTVGRGEQHHIHSCPPPQLLRPARVTAWAAFPSRFPTPSPTAGMPSLSPSFNKTPNYYYLQSLSTIICCSYTSSPCASLYTFLLQILTFLNLF